MAYSAIVWAYRPSRTAAESRFGDADSSAGQVEPSFADNPRWWTAWKQNAC